MLNMNMLCQKIKEKFTLRAIDFDFKVILVILNLHCNLHTIGSHYAKYEHPPSKNERGVSIMSHKTDLQHIDLDL